MGKASWLHLHLLTVAPWRISRCTHLLSFSLHCWYILHVSKSSLWPHSNNTHTSLLCIGCSLHLHTHSSIPYRIGWYILQLSISWPCTLSSSFVLIIVPNKHNCAHRDTLSLIGWHYFSSSLWIRWQRCAAAATALAFAVSLPRLVYHKVYLLSYHQFPYHYHRRGSRCTIIKMLFKTVVLLTKPIHVMYSQRQHFSCQGCALPCYCCNLRNSLACLIFAVSLELYIMRSILSSESSSYADWWWLQQWWPWQWQLVFVFRDVFVF